MASRLKKMKYSSVDMVNRGANPYADIKIFKSLDGSEERVNKGTGEAFDFCIALYKSMAEVINDSRIGLQKKQELMNENLADFNEQIAKSFSEWADPVDADSNFKSSEKRIEGLQSCKEFIEHLLNVSKNGIDEEISTEDEDVSVNEVDSINVENNEDVEKSSEVFEIKKALKTAVSEVSELKKSLEIKDLSILAKKYESIGKDAKETAQMLYELKNSSNEAYESVIKAYDEMVDVIKTSDVFKEIGSSRKNVGVNDLESLVLEIKKNDPELTREQAVIKAFEANPSLDPMTGRLKV